MVASRYTYRKDSTVRVTETGSRYLVIDDVLSPEQARAALRRFNELQLSARINAGASGLLDGITFRGAATTVSPNSGAGGEIDSLIVDTIKRTLDKHGSNTFGTNAIRELAFTVAAWAYPQGTQLSWHRDADKIGAYIWYVHDNWSASWGGELLVVDKSASDVESEWHQPEGLNHLGNNMVDATPIRCILARPNRMILLKPDTFHTVRRVDKAAGENLRKSFTGFLLGNQTDT
jgi:hypothetical protein